MGGGGASCSAPWPVGRTCLAADSSVAAAVIAWTSPLMNSPGNGGLCALAPNQAMTSLPITDYRLMFPRVSESTILLELSLQSKIAQRREEMFLEGVR